MNLLQLLTWQLLVMGKLLADSMQLSIALATILAPDKSRLSCMSCVSITAGTSGLSGFLTCGALNMHTLSKARQEAKTRKNIPHN